MSDPAAIRKVLVENPHDYRKSALERRILSPRLRNGLVAVEGEQWSRQRRTLAPLFGRKAVLQLAPAMAGATAALIARWRDRPDGNLLDVKTEMSALALDGLARSIFHEGLAGDPQAVRSAMVTFFETAGRIDPFDVIGLPEFIPRITNGGCVGCCAPSIRRSMRQSPSAVAGCTKLRPALRTTCSGSCLQPATPKPEKA